MVKHQVWSHQVSLKNGVLLVSEEDGENVIVPLILSSKLLPDGAIFVLPGPIGA